MDEFSLLGFIFNHLGLVIGLIILLVATSILPGRIRWYVLSAGLAVIAFRAFQLYSAEKRLKEADKERETLRGNLTELNKQRETLAKDLVGLNNTLSGVKTEQNTLAQESKALIETGIDVSVEKAKLDEKMVTLETQDKQLLDQIHIRENALKEYNNAVNAYQDLKKVDASKMTAAQLAKYASEME